MAFAFRNFKFEEHTRINRLPISGFAHQRWATLATAVKYCGEASHKADIPS